MYGEQEDGQVAAFDPQRSKPTNGIDASSIDNVVQRYDRVYEHCDGLEEVGHDQEEDQLVSKQPPRRMYCQVEVDCNET